MDRGSFQSGGDVSAHGQRLGHRGPNGQGIYLKPDVSLVHTPLSILDLSSTGAQPMSNEDGIVWTNFNGEIYNYHDLRRGLEAREHKFNGRLDGEVVTRSHSSQMPASCTESMRRDRWI